MAGGYREAATSPGTPAAAYRHGAERAPKTFSLGQNTRRAGESFPFSGQPDVAPAPPLQPPAPYAERVPTRRKQGARRVGSDSYCKEGELWPPN